VENNLQRPVTILSRVLAYIDALEVSPGEVYFPALAQALVERYGFQKFPQTLEEFDLSKGIEFLSGVSNGVGIGKFVIWPNILVLETRVSTDASKEILESILVWATEKFSLRYVPGDIKRFAYISDVTFNSDESLLIFDPVLNWLSHQVSDALTEIWQEPVEYLPTSLKIGHDPVLRQAGIAPFSIERRGTARFSENKYFSEAPLPTDLHIKLLDEFEAMVHLKAKEL
jgi:hypothetical protein